MVTVLAGPGIGEHRARQCGQPKSIIEFAIGKQSSMGGDNGAAKLQRQAAVKN
jgi:hypothetical protein